MDRQEFMQEWEKKSCRQQALAVLRNHPILEVSRQDFLQEVWLDCWQRTDFDPARGKFISWVYWRARAVRDRLQARYEKVRFRSYVERLNLRETDPGTGPEGRANYTLFVPLSNSLLFSYEQEFFAEEEQDTQQIQRALLAATIEELKSSPYKVIRQQGKALEAFCQLTLQDGRKPTAVKVAEKMQVGYHVAQKALLAGQELVRERYAAQKGQ